MDHLIGCASSSIHLLPFSLTLPQPTLQPHIQERNSVRLLENFDSNHELRVFSYFGTLHEINPEQSTIALEDVYSFGTEGREPSADKFVPASQQKFDYIVFRGSDVKDIKIAEEEKENKPPEPQNVLNDPAIVVSNKTFPFACAPSWVMLSLLIEHKFR
jgi:Scd6-like Sm domain